MVGCMSSRWVLQADNMLCFSLSYVFVPFIVFCVTTSIGAAWAWLLCGPHCHHWEQTIGRKVASHREQGDQDSYRVGTRISSPGGSWSQRDSIRAPQTRTRSAVPQEPPAESTTLGCSPAIAIASRALQLPLPYRTTCTCAQCCSTSPCPLLQALPWVRPLQVSSPRRPPSPALLPPPPGRMCGTRRPPAPLRGKSRSRCSVPLCFVHR
jgi:hypothetical protein